MTTVAPAHSSTATSPSEKQVMATTTTTLGDNERVNSLYDRLKEHHIIPEMVQKELGPFLWIERRFCGFITTNVSMMGIWLPTFTCFHNLIGPYFGVPIVDSNKCKVSPDLRRKVAVVASMVAQCAYCSAHYCGLGDAFKGSIMSRKQQPPLKVLPSDVSEDERICLKMVVNAVKIPARVTPEMRAQALKTFGPAGFEVIASIVGFTGFSNTNADCQGTELCVEAQENAKKFISGFGWTNKYFKTKEDSKWTDQDKKAKDEVKKGKRKPDWITGGIFTLLFTIQNAGKLNEKLLKMTPKKEAELNAFVKKRYGFIPRYWANVKDLAARRIMANTFFQLVVGQSSKVTNDISLTSLHAGAASIPAMPVDQFIDDRFNNVLSAHIKVVLGYVFFASCDNGYLAAHFAKTAEHMQIPAIVLRASVEVGGNWTSFQLTPETKTLDAFLVYAFLVARRQRADFYPLAEKLVDLKNSSVQIVMEVVGLLSYLSFLHRFTAVFNDDTLDIEADVKALAESEYGATLGLKGIYLGANSKEFAADTVTKFATSIVASSFGANSRTGADSNVGTESAPSPIEKDSPTGDAPSVWGGKVQY
ncbi:hypothetical protein HDV05_003083 [Chytridiales sp. JEL 0842]|nr:hypothetical protein HDV05_003083 [Chytridiales sp. JEL 0842]